MSKHTLFPHYDGRGFIEYLLISKLATNITYNDEGLLIEWSNEFDRLNSKQKAELIKARLTERPSKG